MPLTLRRLLMGAMALTSLLVASSVTHAQFVNEGASSTIATGGTNGGVSLSGGAVPAYNNCYWNDTDSCTTTNIRLRERVFIGNGVLMTDNQTAGEVGTFISSSSVGANWIPRDAQFLSMTDHGSIGVAGISQNIGSTGGVGADTIGVAGYAMLNSVTTGKAWGGYFEAQFNPTTIVGSSAFGIEVDCKNASSASQTADPYTTGNGCYGVWLAGGGGTTYGPATPNPANAAILVRANATTWNEGIVIQNGALSGAHAIEMPNAYDVEWYSASGNMSAFINSIGTVANDSVQLRFGNDSATFLENAAGAGALDFALVRQDATLSGGTTIYVMDAFGADSLGAGLTWSRTSAIASTTTGTTGNVGEFIFQTLSGSTLQTSMTLQPNLIQLRTGTINGATSVGLQIDSGQIVGFGTPGFTANGAVATAMSSLGPASAHATIQEWLTVKDVGGTVRYIPAF